MVEGDIDTSRVTVIDAVRKLTSILPAGTASEPKTLAQMVGKLVGSVSNRAPTVVVDDGIATEENITRLVDNGYRYVVVSRRRHRQFDDDQAVANCVGELLESWGLDATVLSHSGVALERIAASPHAFDLVIADQTVPKITGTELAVAIEKLRSDLPIVLCTGYTETSLEHRVVVCQAIRGVLKKPIEVPALLQLVAQWLRSTRRRSIPTDG